MKKNIFLNGFYQILAIVVSVINTAYISRTLGVERIGEYSYAQSIVTYFALLAVLGTSYYGQREIAYKKSDLAARNRSFSEILMFRIITVAFSLVLFFALIFSRADNKLLYAAASLEIFAVVFDITWFFQGIENFFIIVLCNGSAKLLSMLGLFIFVKSEADLIKYVLIMQLTAIFGNIGMLAFARGKVHWTKLSRSFLKPHFVPAFSLFVSQAIISIYTVLDKTMIGLISKSDFENGYYEQSIKLIRAITALFTSLGAVFASRIAILWNQKDTKQLKAVLETSFRIVFALSLPMVLGVWLLASRVVPIYYGKGYDPVILLLQVQALLLPIVGCSNIIGIQLLVPTQNEKKLTYSAIAGSVCNVIVNLLLIPRLGALGASFASVAAEFAVLAVQYCFIPGELRSPRVFGIFFRYLALAACMYGAGWIATQYIGFGIINTMLIFGICVVTYGVLLLVTRDPLIGLIVKREQV